MARLLEGLRALWSGRVIDDVLALVLDSAIENARLHRDALERAKIDQALKVAASIQQTLLPASNRDGSFFSAAASRRDS